MNVERKSVFKSILSIKKIMLSVTHSSLVPFTGKHIEDGSSLTVVQPMALLSVT